MIWALKTCPSLGSSGKLLACSRPLRMTRSSKPSSFARPEHAEGELRRLLPAELAARIDWPTLALFPGTYVDDALRSRHSDLLFSATCAGKAPVLLYLLFEHQSTDDPLMAFRLLRYMVRIWDEHLRDHPTAARLPAILPLVLHHSPGGWTSPTDFHALLDLDAEALPLVAAHVPSFRFLLDDVSAESDEALRARAMTALGRLVLFCLRHAREPGRFAHEIARWLGLIAEARDAPGGAEALLLIWRYIVTANNPADPQELVKQLLAVVGKQEEREIMSIADWYEDRGRQAGLEKGRDEGLKIGARNLLLRQLRARFGALPAAAEAHIQAADAAQLDIWADRILTAATLDDVLAVG
jgi:predicted transposase YdaD